MRIPVHSPILLFALAGLAAAPASAKEIRVFNIGKTFSDWCRNLRKELRVEKLKIQYWRLFREVFVQLGTLVAQYAGYFYFAYQTMRGVFTIGDMVMFFAAFYRAQGYLIQLLGALTRLYETNLLSEAL